MFHTYWRLHNILSVVAQGVLVMSAIPISNTARAQSAAASNDSAAQSSPADILQYISAGWDNLTRGMNRCESLEDTKTGGEAFLYLPADMAIPPEVAELQNHCRVRVKHLPMKITVPGQIDLGHNSK